MCKSLKWSNAKDKEENLHLDFSVSPNIYSVVPEWKRLEEYLWLVLKNSILDTRNESALSRKILGYDTNLKISVYVHIYNLSAERIDPFGDVCARVNEWKSKKQQVCSACNTQIYLQARESGDDNKQNF